jgi:preprotein translocase subunit SecG
MHQILIVLQILVAVSLIGLVLIQQGRGADAGAAFGSGSAGSVFGARGPATLLTRATAFLAAVFFVNSIGLAYVTRQQSLETRSVMERIEATATPSDGPATPPASGSGVTASDLPTVPEEDAEKQP